MQNFKTRIHGDLLSRFLHNFLQTGFSRGLEAGKFYSFRMIESHVKKRHRLVAKPNLRAFSVAQNCNKEVAGTKCHEVMQFSAQEQEKETSVLTVMFLITVSVVGNIFSRTSTCKLPSRVIMIEKENPIFRVSGNVTNSWNRFKCS